MIPHDFDQPVKDRNQAILFIMDQLRLDEEHYLSIAESLDEYIKEESGTLLVPIRRYNCVLIFNK